MRKFLTLIIQNFIILSRCAICKNFRILALADSHIWTLMSAIYRCQCRIQTRQKTDVKFHKSLIYQNLLLAKTASFQHLSILQFSREFSETLRATVSLESCFCLMSQKVFFAISKSSKNICDKVHHHASSFTKNIFHQRSFTLLLTDSDICGNCLVCKYIKVSFKTINYVFYGNSQVPPCLVFDHTGKTRKLMSLFKIILYKYLAKIICVIYYAQKDI